ncbi:MAG: protein kinase [Polyangiaceae bacterium]|nr:protein kinase [Polyangiaceae bacterium]
MGVVYRAQHETTGVRVALKTVQVEGESLVAGVRREIRALGALDHPGVVRIVDDGTDRGVPWYAMEILEGPTLRQLHRDRVATPITRSGPRSEFQEAATRPISPELVIGERRDTVEPTGPTRFLPIDGGDRLQTALSIVRTLCRTLAFVHGKGIVHRDLKPDNVIMVEGRGPVILDFGIAVRSMGASSRETLDSAGRPIGSPAYMAPEQIRGDIVDSRADLYAVGCMLFEIVTGRVPFENEQLSSILSRKVHGEAPSPRAFVPTISDDLEQLVVRLLARRPEDRLGHADDVATALAALGAADIGPPGPIAEPYLHRPQLSGRETALGAVLEALIACSSGKPSSRRESGIDLKPSPKAKSIIGTVGTLDVTSRAEPVAASSAQGSFVFVGGESGVGKTRLSIEVATSAVRRGFNVVTCQCIRLDTEADVREGAVRAAPLHAFQSLLVGIADRCRARGELTFEEILGERGPILAPYEPSFSSLPGFDRYPTPPDLPPEAARSRVLQALADTLSAFAADTPLLLVIDDLQWADELSLAFYRSLDQRWFSSNAVVVVSTYRIEEMSRELDVLLKTSGALNVVLDRLGEEAVVRVVSDMLAVEVPDPRLVSFLLARSEGNPFFIAEYLRAAIGRELLRRDDRGIWHYEAEGGSGASIDALPLPRTIQDVIAMRIAGLSIEATNIARIMAVLGRELDDQLLDVALGTSRVLESDGLRELLRRQVLEDRGNGRVRFVHDKLREVTYGGIAEADRPAAHLAAARALESWGERAGEIERLAPELAHHYAEASENERACQYLERAGEQAMAEGSYSDAARYFDRAAGLAPKLPRSARDRVRLARWVRNTAKAFHALGDLQNAEIKGREALRIATGTDSLVDLEYRGKASNRARFVAGTVGAVGTQLFGLLDRLDRLAPGQAGADLSREAALACEKLAETYLFLNDQTRAALATVLAGNHAQALGPSPELARACSQLAIAATYVPAHTIGKVYADRAKRIAGLLQDRHTDLHVEFMRGFWSAGIADGREARHCLTNALRLSRELSDRRREEECLALLGMLEAIHGLYDGALDRYRELEDLALRSQNEQARFWAAAGRAQVLGRTGRSHTTIEDYDHLQPYIEGTGDMSERIQLVIAAPVYVEKGLRDRAVRALDDFLRLTVDQSPAGCMLFWSYSAACETAFLLLDTASTYERRSLERRARQTAEVMDQFARIFPIGRSEASRARARIHWYDGEERAARKLFERAVAEATRFDLPMEAKKARADLSRLRA